MRKFSEYNKAKYIALLFSVTLLGGSSIGALGKVLDINFFQGMWVFVGYLFIGVLVTFHQYIIVKFDNWLIK
jgi:hypothetical protein